MISSGSRYKEQYALHNLSSRAQEGRVTTAGEEGIVQAVQHDGLGCDAECLHGTMMKHVQYNLPLLDDCLRGAPTVRRRAECAQSQQVLGWSMYDQMIDHWLEVFPLEQLMFVKSSALAAASDHTRPFRGAWSSADFTRAQTTLAGILEFLEVPPHLYSEMALSQAYNTANSYGWNDTATSSDAAGSAAASPNDQGASCDETCVATASLTKPVQACLDQFYT